MDVVNKIKSQYSRVLTKNDWQHLQSVAEYYLLVSAKLKKKNIRIKQNQLLLRNAQKRLFLGIGCELLLKSFYLKNGYCVNKVKNSIDKYQVPVHKLSNLNQADINEKDTFTFNSLIDSLQKLKKLSSHKKIKEGFQIAMTFRNKEGHISFPSHEFDSEDYKSVSDAVEHFYSEAFNEKITFNISMKPNEKGYFKKIT